MLVWSPECGLKYSFTSAFESWVVRALITECFPLWLWFTSASGNEAFPVRGRERVLQAQTGTGVGRNTAIWTVNRYGSATGRTGSTSRSCRAAPPGSSSRLLMFLCLSFVENSVIFVEKHIWDHNTFTLCACFFILCLSWGWSWCHHDDVITHGFKCKWRHARIQNRSASG